MSMIESFQLPANFEIEPELRDQLSGRPGHQRCIEGAGELLLILHEVPEPGIPERQAIAFWKRHDRRWVQAKGAGVSGVGELLDRYARAIDGHEELIEEADTAAEIFGIIRHAGPLARSSRNLVQALEQALAIDPEDREIRGYRDRAREVERAADLLQADARATLEFWRAERAEEHSRSAARLGRIAFRLNLLAGFFLPVVAIGGLLGMNVRLPDFLMPMFWGISFGGMAVGGALVWMVGRQTGDSADFDDKNGD